MSSAVETAKQLADGDFDQALERAIAFGLQEGFRQERARIGGILQSDEAQGCVGSAQLIALHDSRISIEAARTILGAAPSAERHDANVVNMAVWRQLFGEPE